MITMTLDETWDLIRDLNAEAHEVARDEWEQADLLEEEGDLDGAEEQREEAFNTIADVDASGLWPGKVVTEVTTVGDFWEAEPEHQDYLMHRPNGYTCHRPRPHWVLPRRDAAE